MRKTQTITSCAVSLNKIRDFAVKKYAELKEKVIAITKIRYMLIAMKTGTHSVRWYKDLIDENMTSKYNLGRQVKNNAHVLLCKIELRQEMYSDINNECMIVSLVSMNKLRYGTLAVRPWL